MSIHELSFLDIGMRGSSLKMVLPPSREFRTPEKGAPGQGGKPETPSCRARSRSLPIRESGFGAGVSCLPVGTICAGLDLRWEGKDKESPRGGTGVHLTENSEKRYKEHFGVGQPEAWLHPQHQSKPVSCREHWSMWLPPSLLNSMQCVQMPAVVPVPAELHAERTCRQSHPSLVEQVWHKPPCLT